MNALIPSPVAVIVGASSGIGAALARQLADEGYRVALVARNEAALNEVAQAIRDLHSEEAARVYPHDVTDYAAVPEMFRRILAEMERIDAVIYTAGVLHPVAEDEYDFTKDRPMLEVNLLGAVAWLGQAAAYFQTQGQGHIVGLSSVAGDRGRVKNPTYQASKAGLTNYLESLRNRLSRHGVHVLTVKPGFVDTPMLQQAGGAAFWVISPEKAAADITKALRKKKQVIYTPARWRWLMLVIQHIPSFIFRRLRF
ncbi:MAG TPA: SDR family NAD(P)-dependent oxidoreductase [Anaerolineae bacterium]|nr:SDR family NAD(P)-dependent oxidoreductase [Anaerolineae bacterium]HID84424.1 SDR family NAD(P)-dependent oxidoreductase [Anaerolineales bacterium]HIQ07923.1 SDR family NAD(P)-dependent oxidoreductase [Anaerolineaceae bacterium]